MKDQRAQLLQKIKSSSRALVAIEQEILNAFSVENGFLLGDLSDCISTERIRAHTTHTIRSGALLAKDRNSKISSTSEEFRRALRLRRRWSVDLYQTPNQTYKDAHHLSKDDDGAIDDAVERDPLLQRHKLNPSELKSNKSTVYLETERAVIHHGAFNEIDRIGRWFYDETLDIGLDAIYRLLGCEHQNIAILGTGFAWELYTIGDNETANLQPTKKLQENIGKRQFTIIPISNGWKHMRKGDVYAGSLGSHWTIMVIDCHGPVIHARHYDSDNSHRATQNSAAAMVLLRGFSKTYAQTRSEYSIKQETLEANFHREEGCPNQMRDNQCKADGGGACGPFVWAFAKEIAQYIIECREDAQRLGTHVDVDMTLPTGFAQRWAWDSSATRKSLKNLVGRDRRSRVRLIGTHDWWGKPGWKDWLAARKAWITVNYFWDPWHGVLE